MLSIYQHHLLETLTQFIRISWAHWSLMTSACSIYWKLDSFKTARSVRVFVNFARPELTSCDRLSKRRIVWSLEGEHVLLRQHEWLFAVSCYRLLWCVYALTDPPQRTFSARNELRGTSASSSSALSTSTRWTNVIESERVESTYCLGSVGQDRVRVSLALRLQQANDIKSMWEFWFWKC